jgi:aldehyde:ferredoxin oxidoreductase
VRLLHERALGADPLGPDNPLIFTVGPLTATPAPTAGRFSLVTRSPLTGTVSIIGPGDGTRRANPIPASSTNWGWIGLVEFV